MEEERLTLMKRAALRMMSHCASLCKPIRYFTSTSIGEGLVTAGLLSNTRIHPNGKLAHLPA